MEFDFIRFLKQLPFVRLIFPLTAGIVIALNSDFNITGIAIFLSVLFILLPVSVKFIFNKDIFGLRFIPGIVIYVILFLTGFILLKVNEPHKISVLNEKITARAVIDEPLSEKENSYKSILKSVTYNIGDTTVSEKSKIVVYFEKSEKARNLKYGDLIIFKGIINEIKNPGNPHEFDYKKYLFRKGITGQVYLKADNFSIISSGNGNPVFEKSYKLRNYLEGIYKQYGIKGDELAVLQALTLGDKSELDDDLRQSYVSSGAMHVLAVSGLHTGIIFMLLIFLLKFLDKVKSGEIYYGKTVKAIILLTAIWGFAILSGLSPSVRRAAVMFSVIIIAKSLNRPVNIYNSIAASAFILLALNPFLITEVGFQLSYAAVLGIVFYQPKLEKLITVKNKFLFYLWSLTAVSIAAQAGTFPVSLYYFHIFPSLFFVSNIIVIPAATLILTLSVFLLLFSPLPFLPDFISYILNYILYFLNKSVSFIENIPFSDIKNISFHTHDLVFAYLFIISATVFISLKNIKALKLSLLILILWTGINTFQKINFEKNNKLVIYNTNKHTTIDIFGSEDVYLSDLDISDTKAFKYAVISFRQYHNKLDFNFVPLGKKRYETDDFIKINNFLKAGKYNILFLISETDDIPDFKNKIKIDYLVSGGKNYFDIEKINKKADIGTVIFDSSNNYYQNKKKIEICERNGIKYFSVRDKGAFILEF